MQRITQRFVIACAVAFAAVSATPAAADLAAWDQARVTSIAQDLATASEAWWQALRRQPAFVGDAMDENSLLGKSRVLQEMSASLASHTKEGQGHDKTVDQYKSMKEIVDDTEVLAQQAALDEPTMDAWAKVADAMRRIAPYYDPKADTGK
jgi:hypothetical protein